MWRARKHNRAGDKKMIYTSGDIANFMEEIAPLALAEDWDNCGFIVGDKQREVNMIMTCLEISSLSLNEAIEKKVDMIVSHHPLFIDPIYKIDTLNPAGRFIKQLIKNNITLYSAHTNLDICNGGVNDVLAKIIGLKSIKGLNECGKEYSGRYGELEKEMLFNDYIIKIKNSLKVDKVRVCGKIPDKIKTVAVFSGSFDGDISGLIKSKADVLVVGEIKHHDANEIVEQGKCVIAAGHFATERIISFELSKIIAGKFPSITVFPCISEENVFKFY